MEPASDTSEGSSPTKSQRKRKQKAGVINHVQTLSDADWASLDSVNGDQQDDDVLEITDIPIPQSKALNKETIGSNSCVVKGTPLEPSLGTSGTSGMLQGNMANVATLGPNPPMEILVMQADTCKDLKEIVPPQMNPSAKKTLVKSRRLLQRGSWVADADQVEAEVEDEEVHENSSGDMTEQYRGQQRFSSRSKRHRSNSQTKDEESDEKSEEKKVKSEKPNGTTEKEKPSKRRQRVMVTDIGLGDLVWGKLQGYYWWPATVVSYHEAGQDPPQNNSVWLRWFGDESYSQLCLFGDRICSFGRFKEKFDLSKMKQTKYSKALLAAVEEAALRARKDFQNDELDDDDSDPKTTDPSAKEISLDKLVKLEGSPPKPSPKQTFNLSHIPPALRNIGKLRIRWAMTGFLPTGPDGFKPLQEDIGERVSSLSQTKPVKSSSFSTPTASNAPHSTAKSVVPAGARSLESHLVSKTNSSTSLPANKSADTRKQLINKSQKANLLEVRSGKRQLEDLCLGCGSLELVTVHPLFIGGLCSVCEESFIQSCYLFDDDGTQMYCTICADGEQVYLCDSPGCCRAFCSMCIEKLCGKEELDKVADTEVWICYMCHPTSCCGLLKLREDWQHQMQVVFQSGNQMQFDPFPLCKPIPLGERKPIRVLGLFDGIATGLLVLKELGFEIEKYVASEVDPDAVKVTRVHHSDIIHVGDIRKMTESWVKEHGPFDLVMGGSPCNDLSVANPFRKGVYEGTGRLFFEFYRLLTYARPCPHEDPRPFFFLFENVVSMRAEDRDTISRFLQCNPLVLDAKDISPANRARYFWGNLPGMNRPAVPLPSDRLTLQDCLEPNCNRVAQVYKIRTVTTKANSIKQTTKMLFPVEYKDEVTQEWSGDTLWCTELERAFGFPDHYTDVNNMGRVHRQRLLGRAWSVPIIRHLFSPLKDYFKCHVENITSSS